MDDPGWWATVMRRAGLPAGSDVTGVRRRPLADAPGATSSLQRIELAYHGPPGRAPGTVVVKQSSGAGLGTSAGLPPVWRIEARFYRDIAPTVPMRAPACWHAEASDDGRHGLLVLEDYGVWQASDQHHGLTTGELEAALREIARLHAGTWGRERAGPHDWLPHGTYVVGDRMGHLWAMVREAAVARHPALADLGDEVFPRYAPLLAAAGGRTPCVIDGDFKADNLRIADRAHPARGLVVLDFQMASRGLGAHDVAHLLADSPAEPPDATEHRRLCEIWREALAGQGVAGYGPDEAWFDYQLGLALALRIAATADLVPRADARSRETADRVVARVLAAAEACGTAGFVRQVVAG
ncbi:MAG: phosphotransferase [Acidimicrobiales bacterium]